MSKLNSRHGFISLLYSVTDNPLVLWSKSVSTNGRIHRVEDNALNGDKVIEITGPCESLANATASISCPANSVDCLDIKLPILVLVVKNLNQVVRIAFQLIDKERIRRKFILSTIGNGKSGNIQPETARILLKLDEGWNTIEIDLQNLCESVYRTDYRALQRLIVYPNCRIRRIYLLDRHYEHNETPLQLCQAFFDMYMLKWGIQFVEKSCQTIKIHNEIDNDSNQETPIIRPKNSFPETQQEIPSSSNLSENLRIEKAKKKRGLVKYRKRPIYSEPLSSRKPKQQSLPKNNDNEVELQKQIEKVGAMKLKFEKSIHSSIMKNRILDQTKDSGLVNAIGNQFCDEKSLIPMEIETEAAEATKNVKSSYSKLLTTDEAINDILKFRHTVNQKMLDNFRSRGFLMHDVELSVYNSKQRRNSYGQGKLVKKNRIKVDKSCDTVPTEDVTATEEKSSAL